jgi:hypothetical protein
MIGIADLRLTFRRWMKAPQRAATGITAGEAACGVPA